MDWHYQPCFVLASSPPSTSQSFILCSRIGLFEAHALLSKLVTLHGDFTFCHPVALFFWENLEIFKNYGWHCNFLEFFPPPFLSLWVLGVEPGAWGMLYHWAITLALILLFLKLIHLCSRDDYVLTKSLFIFLLHLLAPPPIKLVCKASSPSETWVEVTCHLGAVVVRFLFL